MVFKHSELEIEIKEEEVVEEDNPTWEDLHCKDRDGKCTHLDKSAVADALIAKNHSECYNKVLYTPDGVWSDAEVNHDITDTLVDSLKYKTGVPNARDEIRNLIKDRCYKKGQLLPRDFVIPFCNGELDVSKKDWIFYKGRKRVTPYKMCVDLPLESVDCPKWKKFLNELFYEDDIKTVQVFLGYCLTPSTAAQAALIITGQGGEGKSQIWKPIDAIWGGAYQQLRMTKVHENFQLVGAENTLIGGQDDMPSKWMEDTSVFKSVISAETKTVMEHKNIDQTNIKLYCKFIGLSNHPLQAQHDDTRGFYRRIIPIQVKSQPAHKTGVSIGEMIVKEELPGIVLWLLEGLHYWMEKREIPLSDRIKQNQKDLIEKRDSLHQFAYRYLIKDKSARITTEELLNAYRHYCDEQALEMVAKTMNVFGKRINHILSTLGGKQVDKVPTKYNSEVRKSGWQGFKLPENNSTDWLDEVLS